MRKFTYFYSLLLTALFLLPWSGITAEQLVEGFETGVPPTDWSSQNVKGSPWTRAPKDGYVTVHGGSYYAKVAYASSGGADNYLITPQLRPAAGESLKFYLASQNYAGTTVTIEVSTTNTSTSAFTNVLATYASNTDISSSTYNTEQSVSLADYVDQDIYIAFHVVDNNGGNVYLDDVSGVSLKPDNCPKPTDLSYSNVTATSVDLTWTVGGTEGAWNVLYKATGDADWSTEQVTSNSHTLALTPAKHYEVKVQAVCGVGDESKFSSSVEFDTPCGVMPLPFSEDFSGNIDCWTKVACTSGTGLSSNTFKFNYNTTPPQYLISPELEVVANDVQVEFDYKVGSSYYPESFVLGYSTTTNDISAFTWGTELTGLANTSFSHYSETLPAGVKYVAIQYTANDMSALYIDNFSVTEVVVPTCFVPTGLSASAITSNSVSLSWTEGQPGDDAWVVEYATASNFSGSTEVPATTNNSFPLSSLNPQTTYYVRVKTDCGSSSYSDPSDVISFTTLCGAQPLPFSEDFSGAIDCWTKVACHSETKVVSGEFKFRYSTTPPQYLITPELEVIASGVQVEFDYRVGSSFYPESFVLGYSTTTKEISAFTWGTEQTDLTNTSSSIHYSETMPAGVKYVAIQYTANDMSALYIDNFSVTEYIAPSCFAPTGLSAATDITPDGATFTWSAGGLETQYDYCVVVKNAAADGWVTLGENVRTVTITGKNANTNYDFYVRSNCGGDQSEGVKKSFTTGTVSAPTGVSVSAIGTTTATASWTAGNVANYQWCVVATGAAATWNQSTTSTSASLTGLTAGATYDFYVRSYYPGNGATAAAEKVTFTTQCNAITVTSTYTENFDGISSGIPACWNNDEGTTTNTNYKWKSTTGGQSGRCLVFNGIDNSLGNTNILATPSFTLSADADLIFYWKNKKTGAYKVQISVNGGARTDLITGLTGKDVWTKEERSLSSYVGSTVQFFFCATSANDGSANLFLDEFQIAVEGCRKPASDPVTSAVTPTGATLTWTAGGANTDYQFSLVAAGETPVWDEENVVSALTKSFTGLEPVHSYDFYVRTYCGAGDGNQSEARMVNFTTGCGTYEAPFDANFNGESAGWEVLPACWADGGSTMTTSSYKWHVDNYGGKNSSKGLKCTSMADEEKTNILISPKISLATGNVLSFWCKKTETDNFIVKVTKDNGANFTTVLDLTSFTSASGELKYASLSAFDNETVEIYFCNTTSGQGGTISIDNVRVARGEIFEDVADAASTSRLSALVTADETTDVITTRPMQFNGNYNTLCLPFDLNASQLADADCPLNNCELKIFDYAEEDNGELVVSITGASSITAGTPYFFRYMGATESDRRAVLYKDVTITASEAGEKKDADEPVWYKGVFQTETLTAENEGDNHNVFFLSANNTLYWPAVDYTANAFRAYFYINPSSVSSIKKGMPLRFTESPRVPTGIESPITNDPLPIRKVLENNQVIIIRNGVKYTIQGQVISK